MKYNLITILGPTAVGKTRLGALLAGKFNGEIISADSRQVYVGMDIGSGKDIEDYIVDGKTITSYLVDVIDPKEEFDLFKFNQMFYPAFETIQKKEKTPFLVGGTGLYIDSVLRKYEMVPVDFESSRAKELYEKPEDELRNVLQKLNPALHNTTDLEIKERIVKAILIEETKLKNPPVERPAINSLVIGVAPDREAVKKKITARLKIRLKEGMIEEVETLLKKGVTFEKLMFFGLEYKFVGQYLKDEINYNDMFQKLNSSIHKFAKRQMTFFRKMEKEGVKINWINGADVEVAEKLIKENYFDIE
ncbi:MAG: tRNA (adenosine(37)-N6)-dimethylallyltransferase MiaA [Rhodothermaceae bacterium]